MAKKLRTGVVLFQSGLQRAGAGESPVPKRKREWTWELQTEITLIVGFVGEGTVIRAQGIAEKGRT